MLQQLKANLTNWMHRYHWFIVIALFILTALILTYPSILHLGDRLIGDGGDNYQYFGFQYIAADNIRQFKLPFSYTTVFRYPQGFNFLLGVDSLGGVFIGSILSFIFGQIAGYNISVLIALVFGAAAAYGLYQELIKSKLLAYIGAIAYGFSFYTIARTAGHFNLLWTAGFPMVGYGLVRLYQRGITTRDVAILYIGILVATLGSFQYLMILCISALFFMPLFVIMPQHDVQRFLKDIQNNSKKLILMSIGFLLSMSVLLIPRIHALLSGNYWKPDRVLAYLEYSPSLFDFIVPNRILSIFIQNISGFVGNEMISIERVVFLGWIEIILFALFLLFYPKNKRYVVIVYACSLLGILMLGFTNPNFGIRLPYTILHQFFPFSFVSEPARFYVVLYLFFIWGMLSFMQQIAQALGKKSIMFLFLTLSLVTIERLPYQFWMTDSFSGKKYTEVVRKQTSNAVFDIPINYDNSTYDMLPYNYEKNIISGYFHWFANTPQTKTFVENSSLKNFICYDEVSIQLDTKPLIDNSIEILQTLRKQNISTVVIHKNDLDDHAKYYFPECANTRSYAQAIFPQLLMPNPTTQQQILALFFPTANNSGNSIEFIGDGIFYLDGIAAHPRELVPLHIMLDGEEIPIAQNWQTQKDGNATWDAVLSFPVRTGQKMTFQFDRSHNTDYSFIKLWYRYETTTNMQTIERNSVIKLYEDDDAAVFKIL